MFSAARQSRELARLVSRSFSTGIRHRPRVLPWLTSPRSAGPVLRRWATSKAPHSTASDPAEVEAARCQIQGTAKFEEGDIQGAKELYKRSVEIKKNASSLFDLGATHYHLDEYDDAIAAFKESIMLEPSPEAHTNLALAYIISPVPRPDLAFHHIEIASSLSPENPEITFNHALVLEATGRLEEALEKYKLSKDRGFERAARHIRKVIVKILGNKMNQEEATKDLPDVKPS